MAYPVLDPTCRLTRMDFMAHQISTAKQAGDRCPHQADCVGAHARMGRKSKKAPGELGRVRKWSLAGNVCRNVRDLLEAAAVEARCSEPPGVEVVHEPRAQPLVPRQQRQAQASWVGRLLRVTAHGLDASRESLLGRCAPDGRVVSGSAPIAT